MGQMRFLAPRRDRVPKDALDRAYMAGMEFIPWQCRNRWIDDEIVVERDIDESGNLYIPWQVEGHGELVLSTTSLMERDDPYHLTVELARGTLNRIRNQLAVWQPQGFVVEKKFNDLFKASTECFIRAAVSQDEPAKADGEAERSLAYGLNAIRVMGKEFSEQVLVLRHQQSPKLPTLLAGQIDGKPPVQGQAKEFLSAFNTAVVPFNWRDTELNEGEHDWDLSDKQVEWSRAAGLKICGGPLLKLFQGNLPDWLYLWEDDFETVRTYVLQYVEAVVQRYRGNVHIWHVGSGVNTTGTLILPEEYRLRLTVDAIQLVVQIDARAPVIVSFDQPWAEYLVKEDLDLSPLHFADALVRAELGLAGLGPGGQFRLLAWRDVTARPVGDQSVDRSLEPPRIAAAYFPDDSEQPATGSASKTLVQADGRGIYCWPECEISNAIGQPTRADATFKAECPCGHLEPNE